MSHISHMLTSALCAAEFQSTKEAVPLVDYLLNTSYEPLEIVTVSAEGREGVGGEHVLLGASSRAEGALFCRWKHLKVREGGGLALILVEQSFSI